MSKLQGTDGGLTLPRSLRQVAADLVTGDANTELRAAVEELSLEEILGLFNQPCNEEQAWAVCYQSCVALLRTSRRIEGPEEVRIRRDGTVYLHFQDKTDGYKSTATVLEVIDSLGVMIYKALDYGLSENEERELSAPLEHLIQLMTNSQDSESDTFPDEGYEAVEKEDEETEEEEEEDASLPSNITQKPINKISSFKDVIALCSSHLINPSDASNHYQAVCRALFAESLELRTFLENISSAKENLQKMETQVDSAENLNMLNSSDWALFWGQVMRDLRNGVKLRKVSSQHYAPEPIEYQLTPYEMLMDDIRSKRYKLRKVMVNGDIPPRLRKSAHEIILEFIRSRPPLKPVSARKMKPQPVRPQSLHERLLEDIRADRQLRPTTAEMIRRHRLVMRPLSTSRSFDSSGGGKSFSSQQLSTQPLFLLDRVQEEIRAGSWRLRPVSPTVTRKTRLGAGKSISTPQDLYRSLDATDAPIKLPVSSPSEGGPSGPPESSGQLLGQRRKLLKAPALSEMESFDSDEDLSCSTPVIAKTAPKVLPVFSTPQPDKRQSPQRRLPSEPRSYRTVSSFTPPSRQNSKSLEEFCYPSTLTVEEVMHIRQVLVKAELERYQHYEDIYKSLKEGKLCFSCRTKRFSLFTWSYPCQFCKSHVCSQCCKKMKLPSKPYCTLPFYTLGSPELAKEACQAAEMKRQPFQRSTDDNRNSIRRSVHRFTRQSTDSEESRPAVEPELPKELTIDWVSTNVCLECKKFITDIIFSSKRNMCVATKRARITRKSHSFYMPSSSSINFRPSEQTISEV
ncbi:protein spire homolog 1 isoform X1 [Synchiropus splendidus]|uniref:protein spire homolog 1 isoform X1 n=1 Tax=Synchiropus splendidus TaxID=270530 RepID=UPI00237EA991|nr:protein spire homolog 1 isoform X1 [Synchiropus splendidus]